MRAPELLPDRADHSESLISTSIRNPESISLASHVGFTETVSFGGATVLNRLSSPSLPAFVGIGAVISKSASDRSFNRISERLKVSSVQEIVNEVADSDASTASTSMPDFHFHSLRRETRFPSHNSFCAPTTTSVKLKKLSDHAQPAKPRRKTHFIVLGPDLTSGLQHVLRATPFAFVPMRIDVVNVMQGAKRQLGSVTPFLPDG
eukprot:2370397-Amphidinium_carterae.3